MKWTENNVTFEGSVEEYLALHPVNTTQEFPTRRCSHSRRGKEVIVIDLNGDQHKFVRLKDAATWIGLAAQKHFVPSNLSKRTSNTLYLRDYMCKPGLKWSTEPEQPELKMENA